jgi:hypothetical protein
VSSKDGVGWALLQEALIVYWCIRDLWGHVNLVASTVAKLDDNLPRFMDVQWDIVRATHRIPDPTRVASVAHMCHVVRLFPLQGDY